MIHFLIDKTKHSDEVTTLFREIKSCEETKYYPSTSNYWLPHAPGVYDDIKVYDIFTLHRCKLGDGGYDKVDVSKLFTPNSKCELYVLGKWGDSYSVNGILAVTRDKEDSTLYNIHIMGEVIQSCSGSNLVIPHSENYMIVAVK